MIKKPIRKDLKILTLLIPIAILVLVIYKCLILRYFGKWIFCMASDVIGYYCPGCGGTRAIYALIKGDVIHALWYHPLVPYCAFIYLGYLITNWLEWFEVKFIKGWKFHNWYIWVGLSILGINFIVKNILRLRYGIMMY